MSEIGVTGLLVLLLAAACGLAVGLLLGRRGRHAAEIRLATAEASLAAAEDVAAERERTLELALQRLRSGFDAVAGQALRGNNELFLQLA